MAHPAYRLAALVLGGVAGGHALGGPAFGQDTVLEEVVVTGDDAGSGGGESATGPVEGYVAKRTATAAKSDVPLIETPQAVNVIPAEQVEDQDAQTLSDAVRYTPGVTSGFEGAGDTRRDPINIRGFESQQYLDGLLVPGGAATYGITKAEPYGLERIEVLKGPASVLYGQNAPGGLINMVSKRPTKVGRGEVVLQGGLGAGDFDRLQGQVDVSGPIDPAGTFQYRLIGLAREGNTAVEDQPDDRLYLAPSLTWQPTDSTTFTWLNQYTRDNGGVYQALPVEGTLLDNPNGRLPLSRNGGEAGFDHLDTEFWSTGYILDHEFGENLVFSQVARYGSYRDDYDGIYFDSLQADLRTANRLAYSYGTAVDAFSIDSRLGFKFDTGALSHAVLVGFDVTTTDYGDAFGNAFPQGEGGDVPPLDLFDPDYPGYDGEIDRFYRTESDSRNTGLYAQDVIRYERLTVMAGLRHDWASDRTVGLDTNTGDASISEQDPQATTFRLGAVYRFENGLAPYASYSESFQLVPGYESYGQTFEPTTGQQYEVGIRYEIPDTDALVTLSAFDLYQQNVVTPDPDDPFRSIQTGEINVRGVELEGRASLDSGWDLIAGLSYLDGRITESTVPGQVGEEASRTPEWMASLWAGYHFDRSGPLGGLTLGAGVRHVGSYYSFDAREPGMPEVPATTLVDAHLEYDFGALDAKYAGVSLNATATNLFDERVFSTVDSTYATYGPGREVSASLAYRW